MKIRYKLAFLTFIYIAGISFFAVISIYSWNKNTQIQQSINLGVQLQKDSREVKSLMKDIVFDLFTPKMYGQVRSLTYSPRSAVTLSQWKEAVLQYKKTFSDFMSISNFVKSSDEGLRDQYFTALMMNDRAMEMLKQMEGTLVFLREQYRTVDNLYNKMQKDESLTPFFTEVQETSYFFTNSFESFMNYFIKSLNEEGDRLRRRIIMIFIISAGAVSAISFLLTLYIVRDLSKKLLKVENTFRQVSYGNFSVKMDINSRDEFGEFSKTFTTLVTNLKENVDSILNLTRDIGSFISEGSDLRSLLQLVVQAVVQDTTADSAFILRFDKDGTAIPEAENGRTIDVTDQRILLDYFSRRIIRPTSFIQYRPDEVADKDSELVNLDAVTSMLAVPLMVEGRVFGILAALKIETENNFSDLGITRLRTFAEYASLSIDNFLKYSELIEKREAQYQALSSQVQPHFLYNIMSGILGLNSRGDSEGIKMTIEALKGMLRYIQSKSNWSSLEEEFEFLEKYLSLQRIRFGKRLEYSLELDDGIRHLQIPRLLLQPLVENAVIHGIEPIEEGGCLNVRAIMVRRLGEKGADIVVSDNGAGFETGDLDKKANIGLSNVRQRVQIAFPDSSFLIESSPDSGTRIELKI
ncbi:MAG: histidine kinase [Spirochaetales bacterium]|nr:histidine kinase [Spirochaetales bacterium]